MLHIYVQSKCTFCHFNYQKYSNRGIFILKDTKVSKFIKKEKENWGGNPRTGEKTKLKEKTQALGGFQTPPKRPSDVIKKAWIKAWSVVKCQKLREYTHDACVCMYASNECQIWWSDEARSGCSTSNYILHWLRVDSYQETSRQDLGSIARARSFTFVDKGEPSTQC